MMERFHSVRTTHIEEGSVADQQASFEEFFQAEHARLYRALCMVVGSRDEAEEIWLGRLPPTVGAMEPRIHDGSNRLPIPGSDECVSQPVSVNDACDAADTRPEARRGCVRSD